MGLPYSAFDIAKYFIFKSQSDEELITNLKLQKLIYYAQGLHLVLHNKPLFNEEIAAWRYGPVVPNLYHSYKEFGSNGIPIDVSFDINTIDEDTREFLDEIYCIFGQFTATRLMEIAHSDKCWGDTKINDSISHEAMKIDLRKYLKNGEK